MRCRNCKAQIDKKTKFCPKCGAKVKRGGRRGVAILLTLAVIGGGVGAAGWKFGILPFQREELAPSPEAFSFLADGFTDRRILDQDSALAAIGDVAGQLGISDVEKEFSEDREDTVEGNTYYRFYQQYEGIPVYGRSVVVAADADGESLVLSGNYAALEDVETEPQIDEAGALESVRQYYDGEEIWTGVETLVIYAPDEKKPELAWSVDVSNGGIQENCLVSAQTGEVLHTVLMTYFADVEDVERDIHVFDAQKATTDVEKIFIDSKGNIYEEGETAWIDEHGTPFTIYGSYLNATLHDEYGNRIDTDLTAAARLVSKNPFTTIKPADTRSKKAVDVLTDVTLSYEFFEKVLEHHSFDNSYGVINVVINDFLGGDPTNADSWSEKGFPVAVLRFGMENSLSLDTIVHEYTHAVERSISNMEYEGESGALMDAYSDIFGEIVEEYSNQKNGNLKAQCDWIHSGRNMISPHQGSQKSPETYQGTYWVNTADTSKSNDWGGVHHNNTVISHAAYLMNQGVGGHFEALSTEELAHLFYETLYILPQDCSFSQFRSLLQTTAGIMNRQGRLSQDQVRCVSNAFFQVGVSMADMPVSKEDFSLEVYGVDNQLYENYTLTVRRGDRPPKDYDGKEVARQGISFQTAGIHELVITDNANPSNSMFLYVNALETGGTKVLPVYTECGLDGIDDLVILPPSDDADPLERYLQAAEKTTSSGSWNEQMNMTANMVMRKGSNTMKAKAKMESSVDVEGWNETDPSTLRISGWADLSVLNQNIRYTMTWQNGTAHYEYTEPEVKTIDTKVDPSYLDFGALTEDMISSSSAKENRLTFTVRGDALTEMGIAAVHDLLPGVSDLKYGDGVIEATLREDSGTIDSMTMTLSVSMTYQGYDVDADYEILYQFQSLTDQ